MKRAAAAAKQPLGGVPSNRRIRWRTNPYRRQKEGAGGEEATTGTANCPETAEEVMEEEEGMEGIVEEAMRMPARRLGQHMDVAQVDLD